ncbi:MAG: flippase-like domain-containing protein, partial [Chitinispirillaceae bacterium]|nr:flippase-like domain-containing protein [Chitinispirillaceae bacterium]
MARVALRRTFLVSAAKVSISILLLSIFLFRADISGIVATVCKVSFITILKIGGLVTAINLLWALKWNILIPDIPFGKVLSLTVSAQYYSIILPGQLSGEVMKVYRMGKDGGDTGLLAASVVIDKLSSLLALLLCALVGLLLSSNAPAVIWIVVVGCILILGVLMLSGMFQRTSNISNNLLMLLPLPGKWRSTLYHWGARYFHAWSGYLRRRQELVRNLILSGITQLLGIFLIDVLATDLDI